uniref:efflux RND transporter periplasmic adaptor subunit n=1 Tax=Flavobacterium sp. TaxID=239 RepID=UPI00404AA1C9
MSRKTLIILLSLVVVAIAVLIYIAKTRKPVGKDVDISKVEISTIIETVSATGKIYPETEVKISSEVSGEIIELPVKEGQVVKKGDLLVRINPDLITSMLNRSVAAFSNSKAGLSQAEAQLKEAKANYDRNKTLFEKGIISKSEWDRIVSAYETAVAGKESAYYNVQSASASVNEARDNLMRTTIYAPSDGTISLLQAELGERVVGTQQMTGTEIMRVANLNNMEVEVDVNENDIVKVNINDEVDIEVDAYLKKKFKGVVTSISNSASTALTADQVTNFKVKIRILESSYKDLLEGKPANYSPFRPGMTATVDIITQKKEKIVIVPISAIVVKADTTKTAETNIAEKKMECVFVKDGDRARIRVIKTGIQDDTNIEILEGLKKDEEIISGPYTTVTKDLKSGDLIQIKVDEKEENSKKDE